VFSPLYLTQKITEIMIAQNIKGNLIFISSIHQDIIHYNPSYSASKAALGMVIKELSIDLAKFGIRVNGIAPGYVRLNADGSPRYHQYSQLEKIGIFPCYIGRAVLYLASDYFSRFTTGAILTIDNGISNIPFNHIY
jgi:NAD(P)-dependent dehydrogenase (short-subunit alcohol dehydrogenase family)